jgi:hypothetical protein
MWSKVKTRFPKNISYVVFLILVPLALYFFFGLQHLGKFETADEHYWYEDSGARIFKYWTSLKTGNLEGTRINTKPGVTLAYVSGPGIIFEKKPEKVVTQRNGVLENHDPVKAEKVNVAFRLPMLIFNGLFCVIFFRLLRKITDNHWLVLFCATFILLSPVIIGISQIVNPDSLLWSFAIASLLSFLAFLKEEKLKLAILCGIFLGLSFLSKYAAIILIPFLALAIMIHFLFQYQSWKEAGILHQKVIKHILIQSNFNLAVAFLGIVIVAVKLVSPVWPLKSLIT